MRVPNRRTLSVLTLSYFPRALPEMRGPNRRDAAIPVLIFWGLLHVRTVKVLWTIYRQNIWFVKAKLLD